MVRRKLSADNVFIGFRHCGSVALAPRPVLITWKPLLTRDRDYELCFFGRVEGLDLGGFVWRYARVLRVEDYRRGDAVSGGDDRREG